VASLLARLQEVVDRSVLEEPDGPCGTLVVVAAALLIVHTLCVAHVLESMSMSGHVHRTIAITYHRLQDHLEAQLVNLPCASV
jgi:hypothetical protein